jgi:hypothetical protein
MSRSTVMKTNAMAYLLVGEAVIIKLVKRNTF